MLTRSRSRRSTSWASSSGESGPERALLRGEFGHLLEAVGGGLGVRGVARLGAELFQGVAHVRRAERPGQVVEPLGGFARSGVLLRLRLRGQIARGLPGLLGRLFGALPGGLVAVLAGGVAGLVGGFVQGVLGVGQLQLGLFLAHAVHGVGRQLAIRAPPPPPVRAPPGRRRRRSGATTRAPGRAPVRDAR